VWHPVKCGALSLQGRRVDILPCRICAFMFVISLETFGKTLLVLLAFRTCSQETSHPLLKGREGEREHPELSPPPGSQSSKGDLRRASLTKNEVRPVYEVYRPYGVVQDRAWRPNRNACETFTYYVCSRGTSEKSEIYTLKTCVTNNPWSLQLWAMNSQPAVIGWRLACA